MGGYCQQRTRLPPVSAPGQDSVGLFSEAFQEGDTFWLERTCSPIALPRSSPSAAPAPCSARRRGAGHHLPHVQGHPCAPWPVTLCCPAGWAQKPTVVPRAGQRNRGPRLPHRRLSCPLNTAMPGAPSPCLDLLAWQQAGLGCWCSPAVVTRAGCAWAPWCHALIQLCPCRRVRTTAAATSLCGPRNHSPSPCGPCSPQH